MRGLFRPSAPFPAERPAPLSEQESRALAEFCRHYKLQFQRPELLKLALTHRSYLSVTGLSSRESNERLEFLGDSVLGLTTSEYLYRQHPNEHEGQLTKTKSLLVSKAILSRRGLAMGLGRFVLMSHSEVESGGRQRLSIIADAFEAVIGAIYLDQGFEAARAFIERWLLRDYREIAADKRHTNYKSHLQEYVQSTFRTHPVYRIRSQMGPDHSKQFMVEVMVGRRVLGAGRGRNKKEAEQAAARDALEKVHPRALEPELAVEPERPATPVESGSRAPRDAREWDQGREPREGAETRGPVAAVAPEEETETPESEDAFAPGVGRRRRTRRGGRGRRRAEPLPREAEGAAPAAPPRPTPPPAPVPSRPAAIALPAAARPPRPRPEPVEREPEPREVEPRPRAFEEDDDEEVGRPEGPLEERHVDPYEFGETPAAFETTSPRDRGAERQVSSARQSAALEPPRPEAAEPPPAASDLDPTERSESSRVAARGDDKAPAPPTGGQRFGRRPGRGASRGGAR